nr:helix-hairpin-helix domain-containing protein [Arenibacter sp. F26102]
MLFIVVFQVLYFVGKSYPASENDNSFLIDEEYQAKLDELKDIIQKKDTFLLYPFNPNYISDYKGYTLGMSTDEIDRLHAFRAKNQYVNSGKEFQKVTLVSDSLLQVLAPYFKFPEWTNKGNSHSIVNNKLDLSSNLKAIPIQNIGNSAIDDKIKDLNKVTAEELRSIKGIGDVLSRRIVKFRDMLGGFVVEKQLSHVYGLESEVVARLLGQFKILESPSISKININQASLYDLTKLVYIKYAVAARIIAYREKNGGINSFDELIEIEDFPTEKLDIIELYLQL